MEEKNKSDNFNRMLKLLIAMFLLISALNIGLNIYFSNVVKNIQKENLAAIEIFINKIKINNSDNNFKIIIDDESSAQIKALSDKYYKEFIVQYNENQSNWLNTWLTILSIVLGLLGLIIPICFMKLYQDKKDEIDKLIDKTERQKEKIEEQKEKFDTIIENTKKQKEEMQLQVDEVNIKYNEISAKAEQVSVDIKKMKAISKYNEGLNKIRTANDDETKLEEGLQLYLEANNLDPNNSTILYAIGNYYACIKNYEKGIKYLKEAIAIEPNIQYYNDLLLTYYENKDYDNAIKIADLSINAKDVTSTISSRAYSIKALIYSERKVIDLTIKNIKNAIKQNVISYQLYDNLAVAYIKIEKYDEAIDLLEDVNKKYPLNKSYYNLVEAYIFSAKFEKALNLIQESLKDKNSKFTYIFTDDYKNWIKELNKVEQSEIIIKIKEFIEQLEKRDRENDK